MARPRVEPDVRAVAKDFGLDPLLLQAVVDAEGNIVKAVQCSLPMVTTRDQALRVTARSAVHALCDFTRETNPQAFVKAWAKKWAPLGATNDPKQLNQYWPTNVLKFWGVVPQHSKVV